MAPAAAAQPLVDAAALKRKNSLVFEQVETDDQPSGDFALKAGSDGGASGSSSGSGGGAATEDASCSSTSNATTTTTPGSPLLRRLLRPNNKATAATQTTTATKTTPTTKTATASFVAPPLLEPALAPAELNGKRLVVCVTGVTGYIAGHVVQRLLAAGHTVRGTCRNPHDERATEHLWRLPGAKERLSLFQADLLGPPGEFDAAVQGSDAVIHTASPYVVQDYKPGEEEERIVAPAIKGTESVLGSATRFSKTVRRVVLTASTASVFTDPVLDPKAKSEEEEVEEKTRPLSSSSSRHRRNLPPLATEEDWNDRADKQKLPYFYAKTKAERRAYELEAAQPTDTSYRWTLATINPPAVLGPPLSSRADGESISQMRDLLSGKIWPCTPYIGVGAVDVRDVAQAHVLAAVLPQAPRGRHLVASKADGYALHAAARVLRRLYPRRWVPLIGLPVRLIALPFCPMLGLPLPMAEAMWAKPARFSTRRAAEGLGKGGGEGEGDEGAAAIPYLPFEKTVADMAEAMISRGMVPDERPVLVVFTIKLVAALVLLAALGAAVAAAVSARAL
jgi:nucleoside-diphosphate-sugar epimerase